MPHDVGNVIHDDFNWGIWNKRKTERFLADLKQKSLLPFNRHRRRQMHQFLVGNLEFVAILFFQMD
jgi:hypothetical protein